MWVCERDGLVSTVVIELFLEERLHLTYSLELNMVKAILLAMESGPESKILYSLAMS